MRADRDSDVTGPGDAATDGPPQDPAATGHPDANGPGTASPPSVSELADRWREADMIELAARDMFELTLEQMQLEGRDPDGPQTGSARSRLDDAIEAHAATASALYGIACDFDPPPRRDAQR
jgi:hypothetical protein